MKTGETSISKSRSYEQIGEFWETHDLSEVWDQTQPAEFDVNVCSITTYYAIERGLSDRLRSVAEKHGISAETLLNLWVQEKTASEGDAA